MLNRNTVIKLANSKWTKWLPGMLHVRAYQLQVDKLNDGLRQMYEENASLIEEIHTLDDELENVAQRRLPIDHLIDRANCGFAVYETNDIDVGECEVMQASIRVPRQISMECHEGRMLRLTHDLLYRLAHDWTKGMIKKLEGSVYTLRARAAITTRAYHKGNQS